MLEEKGLTSYIRYSSVVEEANVLSSPDPTPKTESGKSSSV